MYLSVYGVILYTDNRIRTEYSTEITHNSSHYPYGAHNNGTYVLFCVYKTAKPLA